MDSKTGRSPRRHLSWAKIWDKAVNRGCKVKQHHGCWAYSRSSKTTDVPWQPRWNQGRAKCLKKDQADVGLKRVSLGLHVCMGWAPAELRALVLCLHNAPAYLVLYSKDGQGCNTLLCVSLLATQCSSTYLTLFAHLLGVCTVFDHFSASHPVSVLFHGSYSQESSILIWLKHTSERGKIWSFLK